MSMTAMRAALLAAAAIVLAPPAMAADDASTPAAASTSEVPSPAQFAQTAGVANMWEVQAAQMALDKSQNEGVRDFAQRMVTDHGKAGDEMKQVAEQEDVSVPTALDAAHQTKLDQLTNAAAGEFDQLYVSMNLTAHQEAVNLFKTFSQQGQDGPLKQFAAKTLPTLEEHLGMVQKLSAQ